MAAINSDKGFQGKRVVAFESRMAEQMRTLIMRFGGDPLVAPLAARDAAIGNPALRHQGEDQDTQPLAEEGHDGDGEEKDIMKVILEVDIGLVIKLYYD